MTRARSGVFPTAGPTHGSSRFELLERIGRGGIAEIHRARLLGLEGFSKIVALKVLRPELAAERRHVERFGVEARIGAALDHPNIVSVLDFVELEGRPTIVMEHVRGTDVLRLLAACTQLRRRLPPELCVYVAIEVARALAHAHALPTATACIAGATFLVHGDVSPANIMICETGHVKLIDFGIADASGTANVGLYQFRGKPGYMSPEAVLGRETDGRSDIFALGTVLWEMLTLKRLFKTDDDAETLRNVAEVRIEGRFARHDYIAPPLLDIIARALSRDPALRYQSADAFANALAKWLSEVGQRPTALHMAEHLRDITTRPLTPPPLPSDAEPEPPSVSAVLDLSELEAVLADLDGGESSEGLAALVGGTWQLPWEADDTSALGDGPSEPMALDPWVLPAVFARLAREGTVGALTVSEGLRKKTVFFSQGLLVHVASNIASELLGNQLTQSGLVTADHASRGLEMSHAQGMRLGEALVALRAISAEQLNEAIDAQASARFCELLSWPHGLMTFERGRHPESHPGGRARPLLPLVARGIRQACTPRRALSVLEPFGSRRLSWRAEPARISEALALLPHESRALNVMRNAARVHDVLASGATFATLVLLMVAQTELVRFLEERA